jgi:hypothetical protein
LAGENVASGTSGEESVQGGKGKVNQVMQRENEEMTTEGNWKTFRENERKISQRTFLLIKNFQLQLMLDFVRVIAQNASVTTFINLRRRSSKH